MVIQEDNNSGAAFKQFQIDLMQDLLEQFFIELFTSIASKKDDYILDAY